MWVKVLWAWRLSWEIWVQFCVSIKSKTIYLCMQCTVPEPPVLWACLWHDRMSKVMRDDKSKRLDSYQALVRRSLIWWSPSIHHAIVVWLIMGKQSRSINNFLVDSRELLPWTSLHLTLCAILSTAMKSPAISPSSSPTCKAPLSVPHPCCIDCPLMGHLVILLNSIKLMPKFMSLYP